MSDSVDRPIYKTKNVIKGGGMGGMWFLGFVGSLVYYLQTNSDNFWLVLGAVFKALFWPAFLVYNLLQFIKA